MDSYAWEEGSPQELGLFDIYELLVQELAILKEYNLIQLILKSIKIYERLKERSPDRFFALENLGIPGSTDLTDTSLWGMSIEKRRKIVAESNPFLF